MSVPSRLQLAHTYEVPSVGSAMECVGALVLVGRDMELLAVDDESRVLDAVRIAA